MPMGFLESLFGRRKEAREAVRERASSPQLAVATERELRRQCMEAREDERRRLAMELHDGPVQHLANLVLQLEMAEKALPAEAESAREQLVSASHTVREVLQDLRRFMSELRPFGLGEFSLLTALRHYVQDFQEHYHIPIEFDLQDADWNIGRETQIALFRIVQEALTNVRKHSKASQVALSLKRSGDAATVDIVDNGRGFDLDAVRLNAPRERRLGLLVMQERAESLGGSLQVESTDRGTRIRATIPILPDEDGSGHGTDPRVDRR